MLLWFKVAGLVMWKLLAWLCGSCWPGCVEGAGLVIRQHVVSNEVLTGVCCAVLCVGGGGGW